MAETTVIDLNIDRTPTTTHGVSLARSLLSSNGCPTSPDAVNARGLMAHTRVHRPTRPALRSLVRSDAHSRSTRFVAATYLVDGRYRRPRYYCCSSLWLFSSNNSLALPVYPLLRSVWHKQRN